MYVLYRVAGIRGDDRAGLVRARLRGCFLVLPDLLQAGEGKGFSRWQVKIVGLFAPCFALPLIEPVCGDQASALFEGSSEGGFRGYGFHSSIDHPGADGDVLGPERHQPPVAFLDVPLAFLLDDYRDLLSGSDVVVGLNLESGWVGVKVAFKLTG